MFGDAIRVLFNYLLLGYKIERTVTVNWLSPDPLAMRTPLVGKRHACLRKLSNSEAG